MAQLKWFSRLPYYVSGVVMKKYLATLTLAALCTPLAHAATIQEALATCSAMEDGTARLACFDQLAKDFQEQTDASSKQASTTNPAPGNK